MAHDNVPPSAFELRKHGRDLVGAQADPWGSIRTGKDCGIGKYPSTSLAMNKAWQSAALTAATLLAWLKLLALDGALATAEPKTLRYRILHAAARLSRSGRQRRLKIQASWPWTDAIVTARDRIAALPQAP